MSTEVLLSSGLRRMPVVVDDKETGRYIDFNPADQGFAEDLYGLVSKISAIHEEKEKESKATQDLAARFDISRSEDAEMRQAVDSLFGEGFSRDVFKTRMVAIVDGMTVVENFIYALLDEMDESITENMAKRDARIRKYTDKYSKYKRN